MIDYLTGMWPGWKTKIAAALVFIAGALVFIHDQFIAAGMPLISKFIPAEYQGLVYMLIGVLMFFLRKITKEAEDA
jgi:hypothetical protein